MGITIDGDAFATLAPATPRCYMDFIPGRIEEKHDEIHLVGVVGSYSSRGGVLAQDLTAILRYRSATSVDLAKGLFADDLQSWVNCAPFSIIGDDGETYTRCKYMGHRVVNRGPGFFFIVEVSFRSLGLSFT